MTEDIRIGFFIEDDEIVEENKIFHFYIRGKAWKYSLNLNIYFEEYPLPTIKKLFEIMFKSKDAPKGFGICKMCLDYLLTVYDNEIEHKKERKKIATIFKYIEKYVAYYHLYTEGS